MTDFDECTKRAEAKAKLDKALDISAGAIAAANARQEEAITQCRARLATCIKCGGFDRALREANASIAAAEKPTVTADDLARWVRDANGRAGILSVRGMIAAGQTTAPRGTVLAARNDVAEKITNLTAAKQQLAALASATDQCSSSVGTFSSVYSAAASVDDVLSANKRLLASLDGILKMLDEYLARTWRNHDDDLLIRQVESDSAQQKNVGLTFRVPKVAFDPSTNTISLANDTEATRSFTVRRYRRLVPEVGLAGIYNDVRYPKFSAVKNDAGQLVVKKTTDTSNVDAAITLNLLCNCIGGNFLYPGIQLGVSKAKDYPGILGGLVFRFAQPKQLSIAIGRMMTWYKDLDTLVENGPVGSENDLKADLKRRRAPTALYLGAQFNF